jgi:hypothetical protein
MDSAFTFILPRTEKEFNKKGLTGDFKKLIMKYGPGTEVEYLREKIDLYPVRLLSIKNSNQCVVELLAQPG